ncbi:MAG: DNA polymerase III subunit delta [Chloroflexus sp.]|jgi:DNA polymerase-3 subunit delta|uniref:DNA polymerase III subunit delta n=1 Tax=Chloroflexus aurantiacus (strain ATCC 29366 / DSM 635 / J-10-fl) TaxID=324602 RepID=A9WHB6_CHLAA|nr:MULTISPECIES: DNA polymerase III subunit delta [Chloroflexus]RMG48035.1 MAG: DNA polymerase III subunit delta [Chloroflexota bacterium]ABY35628.1 DNA polymerase III, delta subunit [Chloroflexus aurantiacus J-10-fl]GIV87304.1 MAG: DNA polymerase III subunit delta [Chloroflexus sp.]GIV91920.1 MAG: DNA polymerase III subunit delta [Chloroflexus sp.]HBW67969.1 DNA polymerase III subunit delta [Chloroflexus aurantiacus]
MIYLFYGPNELARSEAVAELRAGLPAEVADLNVSVLDGRKLTIEQLVAACEAHPFLAERRLVIVYDALKHSKAGKGREELRSYCERVPATCDLVFVEQEEVDRRHLLFTYLSKHGVVREFPLLQGAELLRWIEQRAKMLHATIESAAAQRLVELAGNDSRLLANELAKLASYVGRNGKIDLRAVDRLVTDQQEQNLFAFLDELSSRRLGPALRGARALVEDGQAPPYVLFMLARQIRILLQVRQLLSQRRRADEIAAELNLKPFVARKATEQARNFSLPELIHAHDRLLELDHAIKTGRIQAETALELFVVEVCQMPQEVGKR